MKKPVIKLMRIEKGLPLWKMAQKVNVSESLLSRIENHRVEPRPDVLKRIAKALGTTVSNLEENSLVI